MGQACVNAVATLTFAIGLISCGETPSVNSNTETTENTATNTSTTTGERPLVVATTSILCDLTKQVAAQTVDLKCLVGAGADPHTYQPKPEDRKAIEQANLVLYGGYNFEPSIIKLVQASTNTAPKVAVHEVAVPKPIIGEEHDHDHGGEHSEEEKHSEEKAPDPHVWHNPQNGVQMVEAIRSNLEKVAPNNAELYAANTQKVTEEIKQIDSWIKQNIATIPANQRKLVTTHDALGYYTQAYNINYEGAIEGLSTEAEPTAARIAELSKEIKQEKVPTIFAESTHSSKLIERVAQEANVKVSPEKLYADGLGEPGTDADTYQKMLIANTKAIVDGLGGKYTAF
ncbi:MAG: zinc ABC transporter solute-binding protein [Richelia sp. RM2_1_2]|nr:zinc ABC transporter solute-binding protein [Richelia sp. SM2_1_7]NJM19527.1 zinc ABC transporter solute-binding protein [Richelia sp. SM1_7_0]NJN09342.1 zinc ABC transporter solute-binding protein [Richelia sp. RM1_1_1]NJO28395.1 zinc ABC transporter solute-binding protein [Richelia sp. SL_2_1]NJO59005.1 zinc ABC transporter solute-binding protein [Richelia sp. RM2_1_2]